MEKIKAVLFDFDGVMTIDKTGTESICKYISRNMGIDRNLFETEYRKYNIDLLIGKIKHEDIWDNLCKNIGVNIPIKILHDSFIHTPIDNDMYNLVKELKEKRYLTAMLTDNKIDRIKMIEKEFGFDKYFNAIIVSGEIGSGKDTKTIFLKALDKLKIESKESIFIDNQDRNLKVPQELGIKTIFYDDKERNIIGLKEKIKEYGIII